MNFEAWLPINYKLPDGSQTRRTVIGGTDWQVIETRGSGHALLFTESLAKRWISAGLLKSELIQPFQYGTQKYFSLVSSPSQALCLVSDSKSPRTKSEALSFAVALKATRSIDQESPLQDAIYVEKISRLLPTYSISSRTEDEVVLGYWLTGGAPVSAKSFRRLSHMLSWLGAANLKDVVETAGFEVTELVAGNRNESKSLTTQQPASSKPNKDKADKNAGVKNLHFQLPGRPELEEFFNEHIIDIVQNKERYKALGIDFPSAIVLHGPPGCGKTFAVERLVDFLGWPSFQIDASSVASPYIHQTSKKVAEVFEKAMQNSPSVLVIDEMEAFLADREIGAGSSHHRIEEVAEFLRRIPEAIKNEVLIVAMTNRVEMIDSAILRRGRFDHIIMVDYASEEEILSLLNKLVSTLPKASEIDVVPLAKQLSGRPLSDVTFIVREGARLAARSGKDRLDQESLLAALRSAPARGPQVETPRRIGFI